MVLGAAPNPKDTWLKREGEKINPSQPRSRSDGDVKRHSSLHLQGTLRHRHRRPSDSPQSLCNTLKGHRFGGKDNASVLSLLQNNNKPKKTPSVAEGPGIEEAVSQAYCNKHKGQSRQIPALKQAERHVPHSSLPC